MEDMIYLTSFNNNANSSDTEDGFGIPSSSEPLWLLGKSYSALYDQEEIKADICSRFLFTYRKNFAPIGGNGPTSDTGWGCMLRCGQMMLAQALIQQHLGREYRWLEGAPRNDAYNAILSRFLDHKRSCYSLHFLALMGESEGKKVGEWFGPNTVAQVLKKLSSFDEIDKIVVHIAMDNMVIIQDIVQSCKSKDGHWTPLMLFIPLRLGLSEMNSAYINGLKSCLCLRDSVGMIGGKPNHAYYFIGFVENKLLYLDPHKTQPSVVPNVSSQVQIQDLIDSVKELPDESFHPNAVNSMDFEQIDPSIALGFFCRTESDFENLCKCFRLYVLDKQPMLFELCEKAPVDWEGSGAATSSRNSETVHIPKAKSKQQQTYDYESGSESDYELLG